MGDIHRFERQNTSYSIRIFAHSDGEFFPGIILINLSFLKILNIFNVIAYRTEFSEGDREEKTGINIVQSTTICSQTGELFDHFYPVTNLSKFTQKIYNTKVGTKSAYGKTIACEICSETFTFNPNRCGEIKINDGEVHLGHAAVNKTEKFLNHQFNCSKGERRVFF
jgi:hypothetical protein